MFGNQICDDIILQGNTGDEFTRGKLEIDGYTFSEVIGSETGEFTSEVQTIIY